MAMGRRAAERQEALWVPAEEIVKGPGSPFYTRLNSILRDAGFDRWVEDRCEPFYADGQGRPGIPPGVYFRMLMIGYFEGIDSERRIAWRCADSLSLRAFLGYDLTEGTPDHSSLSVIRSRIDLETHQEVFGWILQRLAESKLLKGKTIGVDATTLEANAALRSIVHRDSGETYREFLERLAKESGIETPTRDDLARLDRQRKKKASNKDWTHPHDPDAKITKMKDGRTHLAHKAEHAVDMETGATVAVTLQPADRGDTSSIDETLSETMENLDEARRADGERSRINNDADAKTSTKDEGDEHDDRDNDGRDDAGSVRQIEEVVADKGYHSNDVLRDLKTIEVRSYISEPDRGRRRWGNKEDERDAVYANRKRIRGERGKRLLRQRGELLERPFAHCYDTGGMRRTHLRGHDNIMKRLLIHVGASNLGLLMRKEVGVGTPRGFGDLNRDLLAALFAASARYVKRAIAGALGPKILKHAQIVHRLSLPTSRPAPLAA